MFATTLAILAFPSSALGFSLATGNHLSLIPRAALTFPQKQSPHLSSTTTTGSSGLRLLRLQMTGSNSEEETVVKVDPLVQETSLLLRRLSWLTWWSQLILTTVSSVTLLFARNVIGLSQTQTSSNVLPNFLLAGTGIAISFASIFWTWANRRLSRRMLMLRKNKQQPALSKLQAASMLRKSIQVGVTLNLVGMLFCLLSAEQIVGTLAIKVLTSAAPARTTMALLESSSGSSFLQPLDILVVQANTNTLFSHFTSLVALLYMTKSLAKLDPPTSNAGPERLASGGTRT